MKKPRWREIWARKYNPLLGYMYFMTFLKPDLKWSVCEQRLFVPKGSLQGYFFNAKELEKLILKFGNYLSKQNIKHFSRKYETVFNQELAFWKNFSKYNHAKKTNEQLAQDIRLITKRFIKFGEWQLLAFMALEGPVKKTEKRVSNKQTLEAISTLEKETKINKARLEFLKLCARSKPSKNTLKAYVNKYPWLPVYDFADSPLTLTGLRRQIVAPKKAAKEIKTYRQNRRRGLAAYQEYLKSIRDPKLKKLVQITNAFAYLKELRDDYRRPAYLLLRPFFMEISNRIGTNLTETNHLLPEELVSALKTKNTRKFKLLAYKRIKGFALELKNKEFKIYSGIEPSQALANIVIQKNTSSNVTGQTAFPGKLKGNAKIIYHQAEFNKFKKDDILITPMTHPEFLPIMRLAKAIVTDEGGLTCHAAIIAREMKKPCVIGTKIATKVFKDGDLVEVDANKGIVKKIE